ncbi:DedA family protein [Paenibacillus sp. JCM 10914]|uniref:DedA family protein n=1 Tax=Paenibacillus sp. JCM 10914 TaxID=1236974 RepID=UPI0003CC7153|nr:DedA family protein [Paenibacillus sp. JCM 10914]GAE05065.1 DedA family protein [Paenibacillus sp. JCM 10914]
MDTLLQFIEQIGHYALFLVLCLGLVGLPVPNEVVAMTGGTLAASGILSPVPSFFMIYLGICSGSTVGYMLSRFTASRLLDRFSDRQKIRQFLEVSEKLTRQYGNYAICISAFLPILRNVTPYAVGMKGMPYPNFALFSYTASFLWTSIYYSLGLVVGDKVIDHIGVFINKYGYYVVGAVSLLVALWIISRFMRRNKRSKSEQEIHFHG